MKSQLVGSNVVIAARHFNPSVFNQLWLFRNELVSEEEFEPGSVFTDVFVQVKTPRFVLLVVPDQLQFVPLKQDEDDEHLIEEKVGRIIELLSHTPYIAVGLNFVWHMNLDDLDIRGLTRQLFFKADSAFFKEFDTDDAQFGGYASKDMFGCRFKVDIKPITVLEEPRERVQFAFNYHKDIMHPIKVVQEIKEVLGHWNEARAESERLVKLF
jgi:hypothetical protein